MSRSLQKQAEDLIHSLHFSLIDKYLGEIEASAESFSEKEKSYTPPLNAVLFDPKGIEIKCYINFETLKKIIKKFEELDSNIN